MRRAKIVATLGPATSSLEAIRGLVDAHAARTGTEVKLAGRLGALAELGLPLKICIYRFVEEGLNNAFKHADGVGQSVGVDCGRAIMRTEDPSIRVNA